MDYVIVRNNIDKFIILGKYFRLGKVIKYKVIKYFPVNILYIGIIYRLLKSYLLFIS